MSELSPPPSTPRARARPLWLTSLALVVGPAILAFVLVVSGGWWLWTTTTGLRATALVVTTFMPGITIAGVDGSLASGFSVATFAVRLADTAVVIDGLAVEPKDWMPFTARIEVERLAARRVQIEWVSKPSTGEPPPESIGIPIDVQVTHGRIGELAIGARDATPLVFREIEFTGQANAEVIDLTSVSGEFGRARARGRFRLGALTPFPTDADLELATEWEKRTVQAHVAATGSLHRLQIDLRADDAAARARASATLRLFDPVLLARLVADIESLRSFALARPMSPRCNSARMPIWARLIGPGRRSQSPARSMWKTAHQGRSIAIECRCARCTEPSPGPKISWRWSSPAPKA